jgi:hypothetical protein
MAALEFHKSARDIHIGLRAANIEPDAEDGKYSTHQIALACYELPRLEHQSRQARLQ